MNKSKLALFTFCFILCWCDIFSQNKKVQENDVDLNKNFDMLNNEENQKKKNYMVSLSSSIIHLSAPTLTEWSPIFAQLEFTNPDSWYEIQYLERNSYHFSIGSNTAISFKSLTTLSRKWGLRYGFSYGFMNFFYDQQYQNLDVHIVNEIRGNGSWLNNQPNQIIPINDPKPYRPYTSYYGFGRQEFNVHNFALPIEFNYALSKTISLSWVNNLMFPFYTTQKYDNDFRFGPQEETKNVSNQYFMNRLVYNTGLGLNYCHENTIDFSLDCLNNTNTLIYQGESRFDGTPLTRTNMMTFKIEIGYKF